jgi:radical SAM-linked protein
MCKIICKYSKTGYLKYISHLDVLRFIQRSVKRAGINANYSEGFNPHMKTSFGYPLSLGTESIGEYFELELNESIDLDLFVNKMNFVMPNEMQIIKANISEYSESLMKRCEYAQYLINIESNTIDENQLNDFFAEMLSKGVIYNRQKKNKKNKLISKELNTKELIEFLKAERVNDNKLKVMAVFKTMETGSMKVEEMIKLIIEKGFETDYYTIMKIDALDKEMKPIL